MERRRGWSKLLFLPTTRLDTDSFLKRLNLIIKEYKLWNRRRPRKSPRKRFPEYDSPLDVRSLVSSISESNGSWQFQNVNIMIMFCVPDPRKLCSDDELWLIDIFQIMSFRESSWLVIIFEFREFWSWYKSENSLGLHHISALLRESPVLAEHQKHQIRAFQTT